MPIAMKVKDMIFAMWEMQQGGGREKRPDPFSL
jgi:hypothetical protein